MFITLVKNTTMENQNTNETTPPAENEIANYYADYQKLELQAAENNVKKARNTCLW
jgi:hypothetical protein